MIKFSIIIPVYNIAPYLRECLDSVLSQTYTDWEAICVDDGSMDGSGAILDEYAEKDERFKIVHQKNQGVSAARNAALEVMDGGWFVFLDADDVWPITTLQNYCEIVRTRPVADMVVLRGRKFVDGEPYPWVGKEQAIELDVKKIVAIDCRSRFFAQGVYRGFTKFAYRKDVHGNLRFKPYKYGEDRLYLIEQLILANEVVAGEAISYGYRMHATSAVHKSMDVRHAEDSIAWNMAAISAIRKSRKNVERPFVRQHANHIIEDAARYIWILWQGNVEVDYLWDKWYGAIEQMLKNGDLNTAQMSVVVLCVMVRFKFMIYLLCVLPLEVKLFILRNRRDGK